MATVYRVYDERLRVHRALKMLSPEMTLQAAIRRRFENEAHTMARLAHPNIVSVHDVGDDGEHVFIVMELIEGGSLMDHLDRFGPLDERTAVDISIGVLRGLNLAHENGVVHRDIKPHNVLLAADGTPKVTDFGIARIQTDDMPGMTRTGSIIGTWAFMAPEQRAGARDLDRRADVYSVGATLVTLVTGDLPGDLFVSELHKKLLLKVPESLREVIQHATRYDASDRFSNAAEMASALEALLPALPPTPAERPKLGQPMRITDKPTRRNTNETMSLAGATLEPVLRSKDTLPPARGMPRSASSPTGGASLTVAPSLVVDPDGGRGPASRQPAIKIVAIGVGLGLLITAAVAAFLTTQDGVPSAGSEADPASQTEIPRPPDAPPGTSRTLLAGNEPPAGAAPSAPPAAVPAAVSAAGAPPAQPTGKPTRPAPAAIAKSARPSPVASAPTASVPAAKVAAEPPPPVAVAPAAAVAEAPARWNASGEATNVRLSDGSKTWPAGEIPPGTYAVVADFAGAEGVKAGSVKIAAGERVTVRCDASFQRCKR